VMAALGFDTFAICGHDRGARCAYRLALDVPRAVTRLAVLDIVPTGEAFGRADKDFALGFWLWSFLAAPRGLPERLLGCDPDALLDYALDAWAEEPGAFPAEVRADYARTLRDPATVHAICEEYWAAATLDCEHDEADRGRRKISCPVLALWAHDGAVANWYDPLEVWRAWRTMYGAARSAPATSCQRRRQRRPTGGCTRSLPPQTNHGLSRDQRPRSRSRS
jgi:haloacetate dehalogenase